MKHIPGKDGPTPGERAAGIITALMLFLCIAMVAVFSYRRSIDPSIDPRDTVMKLAGLERRGKDCRSVAFLRVRHHGKTPFHALQGQHREVSRSGILLLDKTGAIVRSESIGFDDPIARQTDRGFSSSMPVRRKYVMDGDSIRWQDRTDTAILNADISDDGYVTVVTEAKGTTTWSGCTNRTAWNFSAR